MLRGCLRQKRSQFEQHWSLLRFKNSVIHHNLLIHWSFTAWWLRTPLRSFIRRKIKLRSLAAIWWSPNTGKEKKVKTSITFLFVLVWNVHKEEIIVGIKKKLTEKRIKNTSIYVYSRTSQFRVSEYRCTPLSGKIFILAWRRWEVGRKKRFKTSITFFVWLGLKRAEQLFWRL